MTDQGPGLIKSTAELMAAQAPVNIPGPPQPQGGDIDWGAIQQKEAVGNQDTDARHAAEEARLAALQNEYGSLETVSGKFAQGALDALLAPGALLGAGAESAGELFQSKALRDWGRGLGESSSGAAAMAALGGLATAALEGSAIKGAEFQDTAKHRLEETDEARPMLATMSRLAGLSAGAVGMGMGAAGESGTLATILANAGEGAAGGAQAAYEHAAPLRDVLASAGVGALLGGGIAGAGEVAQKAIRRAPDLAKVFGEKAQEFADSRAIKAVVGNDAKSWKSFLKGGPERIERVAERVRSADVLGKGDEGMLEALTMGADEASNTLSQVAKRLDDAGIAPKVERLTERLDEQVAALRKSGSGTEQTIADSLEREVAPFRDKLAIKGVDNLGNEMTMGYRNPSFTELREFKQALGRAKKAHFDSKSLAADETKRLYGHVAETLNDAADNAGPGVARLWKESNEAATDFITLKEGLETAMLRKEKNRFISPSDYGTSIGAGLAAAVMSGNPVVGGLAAIGSALGHKALREGGSAIFSTLANRFARMSHHVSALKAGGPEAAEILSAIGRTKNFMEETAARAGANPTLQQGARQTAKEVATEQLLKKAGPFDPAAWSSKPVSPLQKMLYRSHILDAVSGDLAKTAEKTVAMHPPMPELLDMRRLARLTKDANGTEAIGSLQSLVAESAKAAPGTATGDAVGAELRKLGLALGRSDPAEAMAQAHTIAGRLREAAEHAPDELSKAYAIRSEQALREALSSPEWGSAGQAYAQMIAPPHAALETLMDPAKLRDILRTGQVEKELTGAIENAQNHLASAYDARFKLTGEGRPEGLAKEMSVGRRIFEAAQEAVTIDGRPVARMFDAANATGVYSGVDQNLQAVHEGTLQEHVEKGLDHLTPMLKGESKRAAQLEGTLTTSGAANREEYDKRLKLLTGAVSQPEQAIQGHQIFAGVSPFVGEKLAQLLNDMPKPTHSVQGKVFETLSRDDLRLANAMWEATTEPLSVLSDLAAGTLDPDKASYAWKQYPGLQRAAQAGVMDDLMRLTDEERSDVPGTVLTQVDRALGFNGALQDANEPAFAARMSQLYQPPPQPPKPGGTLNTPAAEPSFTQRIAGSS